VEVSNRRPLRLGEKKKEERWKPQGKNIMSASAMQGGHNKAAIRKPKQTAISTFT